MYFKTDFKVFKMYFQYLNTIFLYYMAKPVLGKSVRSDWFLLGRDFAVRTVSITSRVFLFWSKAGTFKICNQNSKKKSVDIVILHSETTRKS